MIDPGTTTPRLATNYHDTATASLLTDDASSTASPIRQAVELAEVLTALAIATQSPTANAPDPEEQHAPDITDDVFLG
jgi:hypothetical protein